jgi:hypothetical protein
VQAWASAYANPIERVEIVVGRERCRLYSAAEKIRLADAAKHCFAGAALHDGFCRRPTARDLLQPVVRAEVV